MNARIGIFLFLLTLVPGVWMPAKTNACTSVIISGKATRDGRPLMWKNCDTQNLEHRLIYSEYRGYPLIGIARSTATDEDRASIWIGTNVHGFSIMNTLSYNLTENRVSTHNGVVMRRALEVCRTVEEFRSFLDTLSRPMNVEANFGVIDAVGGAAYFETHTDGYHMMDVNDPSVAPEGYLIYTNFSYTGFYDQGQGYIRYHTAIRNFAQGAPAKSFTPQWIFNRLSRSYYHSLLDVDFTTPEALALFRKGYLPDTDFIPRYSTANACIVQGVRPGENPELTTFWAVLGYPPCSVAIPAWVKAGAANNPLLMARQGIYRSEICDMSLALKAEVFPVTRGNGGKYFDFSKVYNGEGTGYMQRIAPLEERIFQMTQDRLGEWYSNGALPAAEMNRLIAEQARLIGEEFPRP